MHDQKHVSFSFCCNCTVGSIKSIHVLYFVKETFVSKKFKNERATFHQIANTYGNKCEGYFGTSACKKNPQIKHTKHIKIAALTKDTAPVRTYQSLEIKKQRKKKQQKRRSAPLQ